MLKKEIIDTLKQTALALSFLLLMPLVFGVNQIRFSEESLSFAWYINWGMYFLLPILMIYLSYMIFASEDSGEASEYLKSLPVNKWKLLAIKILPRFVIILILLSVYVSLFHENFVHQGRYAWFFYPGTPAAIFQAVLLILTLLLYGFMLGISDRKNPILAIAFAIPVLYILLTDCHFNNSFSYFFYRLWWPHFQHTDINTFFVLNSIFQIYIPSVLPILVLLPVFKSWDCSSGRIRSQRILKLMAVPLAIIIALYTISNFHFL